MKVVVAGSRTIDDRETVYQAMLDAPFKVDTLIHGACSRGVDKQADLIGRGTSDIDVETFPADWEELGPSAGPIRNEEMVEEADALIAVWDGESDGTENIIQKALDKGLDLYVKVVD